MKNLKDLKGVKVLSKPQQRLLKGGVQHCDSTHICSTGWYCYYPTPGTNSGYCMRGIEA